MKQQIFHLALLVASALCVYTSAARADVIVLANRTNATIEVRITLPGDKTQANQLQPMQVVPVPVIDEATVEFDSDGVAKQHRIAANTIVYFYKNEATPNVVELAEQHFGENRPLPAKPKPADAAQLARLRTVGVIPVKILVDDEEPAVRMIWEKRLKKRLQMASDSLEKFCLVRLQVVETDTWDSQDGVNDFKFSIREFEKEVRPGPKAALAIGFSSQYDKPNGRAHLGGTRGPLYPYILIREWSQHVAYSQRVEVVVHEIAHVLGAVHSPNMYSVMRPLVNDGQDRARDYKIAFDPLNTMAMYLVCEQLRLNHAKSLRQFSPKCRELLTRVYAQIQEDMPKDTSAQHYAAILQLAAKPPAASSALHNSLTRIASGQNHRRSTSPPADAAKAKTLVSATRVVLAALSKSAKAKQTVAQPCSGDRLTEYYVRIAAAAADKLPPEHGPKAFLLGLAIGLDKSQNLHGQEALARLIRFIEADEQRRDRADKLGNPTMDGRSDLMQHFTVSAALVAIAGKDAARSMGIAKETSDSRGGTGFSFRDLTADMAGVSFAEAVIGRKLRLADLAITFHVDNFLPFSEDLPEGLAEAEFTERFGSTTDPRFHKMEAEIDRRILALTAHVELQP